MKYQNEYSSCEVVPSKAVPGVMELFNLRTDVGHERQGYASDVINEACRDADINAHVLMLSCAPEFKSFYEKFQFIEIQHEPLLMARQPLKWKPTFTPIAKAING